MERTGRGTGGKAKYFIIDEGGQDGSRYALCERVKNADGSDAMPPDEVEELFRGPVLRAVAVPPEKTETRSFTVLSVKIQVEDDD